MIATCEACGASEDVRPLVGRADGALVCQSVQACTATVAKWLHLRYRVPVPFDERSGERMADLADEWVRGVRHG